MQRHGSVRALLQVELTSYSRHVISTLKTVRLKTLLSPGGADGFTCRSKLRNGRDTDRNDAEKSACVQEVLWCMSLFWRGLLAWLIERQMMFSDVKLKRTSTSTRARGMCWWIVLLMTRITPRSFLRSKLDFLFPSRSLFPCLALALSLVWRGLFFCGWKFFFLSFLLINQNYSSCC